MAAWMKFIRVDHVRYLGGKELGKLQFIIYKNIKLDLQSTGTSPGPLLN